MLILRTLIPHTYKAGKSTRKISTNTILGMCWQKRKQLHDSLKQECTAALASSTSVGHQANHTYIVSFGFYSAPKKRDMDLDNLSYIGKVAIDAWRDKMVFDDSFRYIVEVRYRYLGIQPVEQLWMQIEQLTNGEK